ncbi:uncharacterized protein DNG_00924 [Cephalotrichum gorgonifer]|uniref:Uncharacterized protein n=1 Tax=Cephalotrichum gorgonifer TaxID=2041049 RepID=A0AAE8MRP8_9PEZI|nr:uncharacterized protein DNG_00924 [Cephalotrichum gorgonifer]
MAKTTKIERLTWGSGARRLVPKYCASDLVSTSRPRKLEITTVNEDGSKRV